MMVSYKQEELMTESIELWWHAECRHKILVKWLDSFNGLKWFYHEDETDETNAVHVTILELNSLGWEKLETIKEVIKWSHK